VHSANQEVEVKYQIGAAFVALAFALVPGSLSAEPATSVVLATSYVSTTKTLSGLDKSFLSRKLKHTAATSHQFAVVSAVPPDPYLVGDVPPDPYLVGDVPPDPYVVAVPPDPYQPFACRALALNWNVAVYQNRQQSVFDGILKSAATTNCSLQLKLAATTNADGSKDIVSITFAPQ
jgi:hypothetical protein